MNRKELYFAVVVSALTSLMPSVALAQSQDPGTGFSDEDSPGQPPLPPGALRLVNFAWDNGRVAICAEEPGPPVEQGARIFPRTRVWVRDATAMRQIATSAGTCDPVWSPDGRFLAIVAPDGLWKLSGDLQLTSHLVASRHSEVPANEFDHRVFAAPQWAPDGSAVAVLVSNGATGWVEVFDARTGGTLYSSEPETYEFTWESDSVSLRFGSRVIRLP